MGDPAAVLACVGGGKIAQDVHELQALAEVDAQRAEFLERQRAVARDVVGAELRPEFADAAGDEISVFLERRIVKLSEAGYVAAVEADEAELQVAMVVESTSSGTALLGSSRQHVGFDCEVEIPVAAAIARRAARFFPVLREARALRVYAGLRPLTPDHVPIDAQYYVYDGDDDNHSGLKSLGYPKLHICPSNLPTSAPDASSRTPCSV